MNTSHLPKCGPSLAMSLQRRLSGVLPMPEIFAEDPKRLRLAPADLHFE